MSQAHHRSVHHGHVPQISPGALCVLLLSATVEEGHVQRTQRQALLPRLLREIVRLNHRLRGAQNGLLLLTPPLNKLIFSLFTWIFVFFLGFRNQQETISYFCLTNLQEKFFRHAQEINDVRNDIYFPRPIFSEHFFLLVRMFFFRIN